MPIQFWKHVCPRRPYYLFNVPHPCDCGKPTVYDGWRHDFLESMKWYQKLFGVKPCGPHRRLADALFEEVTRLCEACSSRGYFDAADGTTFVKCGRCDGVGYRITGSAQRLAELRHEVLAHYPKAALFDLPPGAFALVVH